jgi:hypothetical protein
MIESKVLFDNIANLRKISAESPAACRWDFTELLAQRHGNKV